MKHQKLAISLPHVLMFGVPIVVLGIIVSMPFVGAATPCTSTTLRQGSRGACVTYMQSLINYVNGTSNAVDGQFGALTSAAVKQAQTTLGLKGDGIVGMGTWKAICDPRAVPTPANYPAVEAQAAGCNGASTTSPPTPTGPTTPSNPTNPPSPSTNTAGKSCISQTFRLGHNGDCVRYIQSLLSYANDTAYAIDGAFGAGTEQALRLTQRYYGVTVNGIVTPAMWSSLCAPRITPVPSTYPVADAKAAGCTVSATLQTYTTQQLAAQLIAKKPNITFTWGMSEINSIAQTGKGSRGNCGNPTISPKLLSVLINMSKKYRIQIGTIIDGHSCNNGGHPRGVAADINQISNLNGTQSVGSSIRENAARTKFALTKPQEILLKQFITDLATQIKAAGGGGIGQSQCYNYSTAPKSTPSVMYFTDRCHHIHFDLMKR